jgi:succinoglycan biosynthesis protein ExoO
VAFLDADDEWLPDHLEHYPALIKAFPEATVLDCGWEIHNPAGLYSDWYPDPYWSRHPENRSPRGGRFPGWSHEPGGRCRYLVALCRPWRLVVWSPHMGGMYHRDAVNMVTRTEAFTGACERETVRRLLPG